MKTLKETTSWIDEDSDEPGADPWETLKEVTSWIWLIVSVAGVIWFAQQDGCFGRSNEWVAEQASILMNEEWAKDPASSTVTVRSMTLVRTSKNSFNYTGICVLNDTDPDPATNIDGQWYHASVVYDGDFMSCDLSVLP